MQTRRKAIIALLAIACTTCSHAPPHNPLAEWVPSPNHNARGAIIVVIHATEQGSVEESLETLRTRNSGGPVSAHYLIGRDGKIYQLVDEGRRAWHAGPGRWGAITDLNSASIGIELDNDGDSPFPQAQIQSLVRLLDDVCKRLDIPRTQVIAHADMAPVRKRDPGRMFPWATLASAGFGRWPGQVPLTVPDGFDGMLALRLLGYPMDDPAAALHAFRLHYRGIDNAVTPITDEDLRVLSGLVGDAFSSAPVAQAATARASSDSSHASSEPSETPSKRKVER